MDEIKKIEIIADSVEMKEIVRLLDELDIEGYTVIPVLAGRGAHGLKDDEGLTGVLSNSMLIVLCSKTQAVRVIEKIRPVLKNAGGIGLISDARWI